MTLFTDLPEPSIGEADVEHHWIEADGIRTRYIDQGSGDPVVLLHGSGPGVTAWANWRRTIPALADRFRVIAPEYVGFGETERPPDIVYGVETWTAHMLAFLDALDLKRVRVVGNSMGGAIALRLARFHPQRVAQMVLMGSGGLRPSQITDGLVRLRSYEPSVDNMRALITGAFLYDSSLLTEELVAERYESSRRPGVHETYRQMFHDQHHKGNEHWLPEEDLRRVHTPTLIVHGREDQVIPPEVGWDLLHVLPDAHLLMLPSCGHWAQLEHARTFNRVVGDFFTGELGDRTGRRSPDAERSRADG